MKKFLSTILIALSFILSPLAAQAQVDQGPYWDNPDFNLCGIHDMPDLRHDVIQMYLGDWRVNHHSGFVKLAGFRVMPFPNAGDNEIVTFKMSGDILILDLPEMQNPMVFRWSTEDPLAFQDGDIAAGMMDPDTVRLAISKWTKCEIEGIPRLIGVTDMLIEGVTMEFTWRLFVVDENIMVAVQHIRGLVGGNPFLSRRTVFLNRDH